MSAHLSSDFAAWRLPDNLDLQLLHHAQTYLRRRERRQIPSVAEDQAWKWFYQTYDPVLRDFVLDCHVPEGDADDCRQQVWMEVVKKLAAFVSDGTQGRFCSWLHTIVHSKATDLLRYRARHPSKHLRSEAEAALPARDAGPVADYERQHRQVALRRVLAVLRQQVSPSSYRAFYLHCMDKHTIEEIAAELNLTQRQVRRCVWKTKRSVRLLCEQDEEKDLLTHG